MIASALFFFLSFFFVVVVVGGLIWYRTMLKDRETDTLSCIQNFKTTGKSKICKYELALSSSSSIHHCY